MEKVVIKVDDPVSSEYIQKLSFKVGYKWLNKKDVQHTDKAFLVFKPDIKTIYWSDQIYENIKANFEEGTIIYIFPEDITKILDFFIKIEYKPGDYVKLTITRPNNWDISGSMNKFLGSIQVIKTIAENNSEIADRSVEFENLETTSWTFQINNIARKATEEEIKTYNKSSDIFIKGLKVEYYPLKEMFKIGCRAFSVADFKAYLQAIVSVKETENILIKRNLLTFYSEDNKIYEINFDKLEQISKKFNI